MAAALSRSGLIRLCNTSLRSLSTSSPWMAEKKLETSWNEVEGKLEMKEVDTTFPRSKKMAELITVEGAVDVSAVSVSVILELTSLYSQSHVQFFVFLNRVSLKNTSRKDTCEFTDPPRTQCSQELME